MSEFTNHQLHRVAHLLELFQLVIKGELNAERVAEFQATIDLTTPADIIAVVDQLVPLPIPMPALKKGINKALNLFGKVLSRFPAETPAPGSFLDALIRNNHQTDLKLKAIRPLLSQFNTKPNEQSIKQELEAKLLDLSRIDLYYQIKENVLFPLIEKHLPDYRCLSVMWSFHDDIRRNLKQAIGLLKSEKPDLKIFNRLAGDLFFNIYAIRFREEHILFPVIADLVPENELNELIPESLEIGFPFIPNPSPTTTARGNFNQVQGEINLQTGFLLPEQIRLIFNHLPVDITYVDENNQVKFFSTPEKRIFRRTNSMIGRDVKNCHPHESVQVVGQIVEAFRNGEKSKASF